MNNREALIRLNLIPGIGSISIHKLLRAFPSGGDLFQAPMLVLKEIVGPQVPMKIIQTILEKKDAGDVAEEMERADKADVSIVTLVDSGYPEILKTIPDPPPVLYVKGKLLLEDSAAVGIVGTRAATSYGLAVARQFGEGFARAGMTVVSGLAEGIDGAAHEGSLDGKGRTLAVLGHGLNHIYPPIHQHLAARIVEAGALVSEFPMEISPWKGNFPRRNRIISGLSLGVVVVEAPVQSGALITAREALEQNREVFAVPGPVSSPMSAGAHRLIQEGAKLVQNPADVLQELERSLKEKVGEWKQAEKNPSKRSELPVLSDEESALFEAIPIAGAAVADNLVEATAMAPSHVLTLLTGLELKGIIRQVAGQGYSRS